MKSCKLHERNETKNIRLLVFSFSSINLDILILFVLFFMWFASFQILICEPESIWRKLLVWSWLYNSIYYTKKVSRTLLKCTHNRHNLDSMLVQNFENWWLYFTSIPTWFTNIALLQPAAAAVKPFSPPFKNLQNEDLCKWQEVHACYLFTYTFISHKPFVKFMFFY